MGSIEDILIGCCLVGYSPNELRDMQGQYHPNDKNTSNPISVMILGIPGAGKTTRIREAKEKLLYDIRVHITGDVMADLARQRYSGRIRAKDDIRKILTPSEQEQLQLQATKTIGEDCSVQGYVHLIDCHLTTATSGGFLFGLAPEHLNNYRPDVMIYLSPPLQDVLENREKDKTRKRDVETLEQLKRHEQVNLSLLKIISEITSTPLVVTHDGNGKISEFIDILQDTIEKYKPVVINSLDSVNSRGKPTNELLLEEDFLDGIYDRLKIMANSGARVRQRSRKWSRETGKVVYVMNNLEGGSIFKYGMEHWASQFRSREEAMEFVRRVKQNPNFDKYAEIMGNPDSVHKYVTEGREYEASYAKDKAKSLLDAAIVQAAKEYLTEGKLDSFVYHITDTRISNDNKEMYYLGQIKARIGDVLDILGIHYMVADTCVRGRCRGFDKYRKEVFKIHGKADCPDTEATEVHEGRVEAADWMHKKLVLYDPNPGQFNAWWDEVPEIIYPATNVQCSTNLGPMNLKDFFRIEVARELGLAETRKGWEHEVEASLSYSLNKG